MKKLFIIGALFLGLYQDISSRYGGHRHHDAWYYYNQDLAIKTHFEIGAKKWKENFDTEIQKVINKINEIAHDAEDCDITQLQTDALNQINACRKDAYAIAADTPAIVGIIKKIKEIFLTFYNKANAAIQECTLS